MKYLFAFLYLNFVLNSCSPRSHKEEINTTVGNVFSSIKSEDFLRFRQLIGIEKLQVIGKTEDWIKDDFYLLVRALKNTPDSVVKKSIIIPQNINEIGQVDFTFKLNYQSDEKPKIKFLLLTIYFGPPRIIPLNKISNYEISFTE